MRIEITDEDLKLIKRALECRIQDLQKYKNLKTIQLVIERLEALEQKITKMQETIERVELNFKT